MLLLGLTLISTIELDHKPNQTRRDREGVMESYISITSSDVVTSHLRNKVEINTAINLSCILIFP